MLNLNPETVQLLVVLVLLGPLLYGVRKLRQFRERPRIAERGYYVGRDQHREESKARLRLVQANFQGKAAKGFHRWPKDAA